MLLDKITAKLSRERIHDDVPNAEIRKIPSGSKSVDEVTVINPLPELIRQASLQSQGSGSSVDKNRPDRAISLESTIFYSQEYDRNDSFSSDIISHELVLSEDDSTLIHDYIELWKQAKEQMLEFDEKKHVEFIEKLLARKKLGPGLDFILRSEIKDNKIGLLREESLGAVLLRCYWFNFEGEKYLTNILKPLIKSVISESKNKPLEIDPVRAENPDVIKKNIKKLLKIIQTFLGTFFKSANLFPPRFEEVLKNFYAVLTDSEGSKKSHLGLGYSEDALRLFGGFLMLRFICPAIVSPVKYGLCKEVNPSAQRSLVLISKTLQGVANQVEFEGEKEPYMMAVNHFVLDTMPSMMSFLKDLMDEERAKRTGSMMKKARH